MTTEETREPVPCGEAVTITTRNDQGEIIRQDVEIHVSAEALRGLMGSVV